MALSFHIKFLASCCGELFAPFFYLFLKICLVVECWMVVQMLKMDYLCYSFPMAINEVQYASTSKEFEISLPREGDNRCRYHELGKPESQKYRKKYSNRKLQGLRYSYIHINHHTIWELRPVICTLY